eukprot:CAMPEP_0178915320 /NCGR_PEP_ID=MMETSP0786-20121207/11958_1 /TAXON_ID=186022 /ORGANISM="Thalassionema frauenfeldii, Strain CCMP 1798" /LENGTH=178 /DNA_ID=CAMNT_0020588411 /DNA_START=16 /DNA_END=552 /DNA_ORIENTATION=+
MKLLFILLSTSSLASCFLVDTTGNANIDSKLHAYVPSGMSPEQWAKMQAAEKKKKAAKNFGAFGPQTFKSRSLRAFQEDLEKGKANHLLPMFNAKEKLKQGKIKQEDIPYMQRGGSWDNSDVSGAKKRSWSSSDKTYKANDAPARPDWLGNVPRSGPKQKQTGKVTSAPPTKKLFGLF